MLKYIVRVTQLEVLQDIAWIFITYPFLTGKLLGIKLGILYIFA